MSDVTRILRSIDEGNPIATDELLELIYAELRQLAAAKLAREQPGESAGWYQKARQSFCRRHEETQRNNSETLIRAPF